jgi:hypothetical protein
MVALLAVTLVALPKLQSTMEPKGLLKFPVVMVALISHQLRCGIGSGFPLFDAAN